MLQVTVSRIDEDDVVLLRKFLAALPERAGELGESYRQQGTRHEQFLLIRTRQLPILVLITEVDDAEQATNSFLRSNLPIDVEFKNLVQEISPEEPEVELLYDSSNYVEVPNRPKE